MAVLSVPRPLQDRLGDDATASLVEVLRQLEEEQEERREVQKEHLFQLLEERFLRHVAESEHRTRTELGKEISGVRQELGKGISGVRQEISGVRQELGKEISDVRTELGKEISDVRQELGKEISDVRKEITTQTRWILAVMGAAAVLIPIMQRVMATLIP